jgi:mycofactocin system glycosyltransferase
MRLPDGVQVRLAPGTMRLGDSVLLGGSPLTALTLSARARRYLRGEVVTVDDPDSARVADRLLVTNLGVPVLDSVTPSSPEELTVVIPVRDRAEQLNRTLTRLAGLRCLVVGDGSLHPQRVGLVAARHGAEYVQLERNVGPAAARNVGLAQVRSPLVAFVDSDVRASPHSLLALTRHFVDPSVALVGPRVMGTRDDSEPRWFHAYERDHSSLTLGEVPANVRPGAAVAWVPSACMVARVAALGIGFDPSLRVGEDVDLVWRLVRSGHRVRYDPSVEVLHDSRVSLREWLGRKVYYGTGSALLGARHGDAIAPAVLTPTFALAAATLLGRHPLAVPATAAAVLLGACTIRRTLPDATGRDAVSLRIAARGMTWAVRQEAALLLRHWWPLTVMAAPASRTVRRAVVSALLVDLAVQWCEQPAARRSLGPREVAARRLDDLAYGAGLWLGAARHRSLRALLPVSPRGRSRKDAWRMTTAAGRA